MRKVDPVEIVAVGLPILLEVVAVCMAFACAVVWIAIANTPAVQP